MTGRRWEAQPPPLVTGPAAFGGGIVTDEDRVLVSNRRPSQCPGYQETSSSRW